MFTRIIFAGAHRAEGSEKSLEEIGSEQARNRHRQRRNNDPNQKHETRGKYGPASREEFGAHRGAARVSVLSKEYDSVMRS